MTALSVADLHAGYSGSNVINGVDLHVEPGEIVTLLGRNGMGKSTLVNVISGSHRATSGQVIVNGTDSSEQGAYRRFHRGLRTVRQERPVVASLTVAENMSLVGKKGLEDGLEAFPFLVSRLTQEAGTLSGGEQKLLALARLTSNPGTVWVLDEPTEGLQPSNVERTGEIIREAASTGIGVLIVEQHLGLALSIAQRYYVLEKGTIVDSGTVDEDTFGRVTQHLSV